MEDLQQLREYIQAQDYAKAMDLIGEMEEMSKEDKLHKIHSYAVILMLHLIKQAAEQRTTRSWDFSVYNATKEIARINRRRKPGGHYASDDELQEIIVDAFETALKRATLEVFQGQFEEDELLQKISPADIKIKTLQLIQQRR
jgi:hypothetical protein